MPNQCVRRKHPKFAIDKYRMGADFGLEDRILNTFVAKKCVIRVFFNAQKESFLVVRTSFSAQDSLNG